MKEDKGRNMKKQDITRRDVLKMSGAALGMGLLGGTVRRSAGARPKPKVNFQYCLNTSTIRGQKLSLVEEIETAAQAGYTGLEPWVHKIQDYARAGGSLPDIKKRLNDHGITVESAIDFAAWIVDDEAQRAKGLEQMKRAMDALAQIGGKRIAAPPAGATRQPGLDLQKAAQRYRVILELGDTMGVVPQIEVWGSSQNLHRLGQSMFVAIESGHPKACLLPDVYHIYKGGSDFHGLKLLSGRAVQVFHMNDYPAEPPREKISDRDRVMPGDGVAPLNQIIRDMATMNPNMILSLELFNPNYWKQDALEVAKLGMAKMKAAVSKALG
jgi:2-keto-myo-inositol isomerase